MTGREVVSSLFLARKRFCNTKKLEKVNKSYTPKDCLSLTLLKIKETMSALRQY